MTSSPPSLDLPDLAGTRALLTGGSDGIGLGIATRLASAGATLLLPVRNQAKGEAAAAGIRLAAPGARVEVLPLDLASLASIERLASTLLDRGDAIHLLINNAGVMTPPSRALTADGFELQFGTNFLGHFALAARLLPLLRAGAARVVSQISIAADRGSIDWDDLNSERSYEGMRAYSQSKIALGLFGLELDRRSVAEGWGLSSALSHPGVAPTSLLAARTELGRARPTAGRRLIGALSRRGLLFGTPDSAGLPALLAATAPDAGGRFYGPGGFQHLGGAPAEQRLYGRLTSTADATAVWQAAERLTGVEPAAR